MGRAIRVKAFGYNFRSQLEFQWAAVFECLGIEYAYEKEKIDLGYTRYVPDFWIPNGEGGGTWLETKGYLPVDSRASKDKIFNKLFFLEQKTGFPAYLLLWRPDYYDVYRATGKNEWGRVSDQETRSLLVIIKNRTAEQIYLARHQGFGAICYIEDHQRSDKGKWSCVFRHTFEDYRIKWASKT